MVDVTYVRIHRSLSDAMLTLPPAASNFNSHTNNFNTKNTNNRGFFHALVEIHRRKGLVKKFFSGLWPAVVKGAVNNCIRFGIYNEAAVAIRRCPGRCHIGMFAR